MGVTGHNMLQLMWCTTTIDLSISCRWGQGLSLDFCGVTELEFRVIWVKEPKGMSVESSAKLESEVGVDKVTSCYVHKLK